MMSGVMTGPPPPPADVVVTDFMGSIDNTITSIAVQTDGKIVAAGSAGDNVGLVRYLPNGTLDPSFGTAGRVTTDFGRREEAGAVVLQPDGRIIVAGDTDILGPFTYLLARY